MFRDLGKKLIYILCREIRNSVSELVFFIFVIILFLTLHPSGKFSRGAPVFNVWIINNCLDDC